MRRYSPLVGRILLGLIFVLSGFNKITGFEGTQQHLASHGLPLTTLLLVGAIVLEIGGGVSLIVGLWPRIGAEILVFFVVPATAIFHTDFSQQIGDYVSKECGSHGRIFARDGLRSRSVHHTFLECTERGGHVCLNC